MKVKCLLMVVAVCCFAGVGHAGLLSNAQADVGGVAYGTPDEPFDSDGSDGYSDTVLGSDGTTSITWSSGFAWSENTDGDGNPNFGGDKSDAANWDNGYCFDNDDWSQYTTYEDARLTMTFSGLDASTDYTMVVAARAKSVTMWDGAGHTEIDYADWQYVWNEVGTYTGADLMNGVIAIEIDRVGTTAGENQRLEIDGVILTGGAVPEPATMTLLGLGSLVTILRRKK